MVKENKRQAMGKKKTLNKKNKYWAIRTPVKNRVLRKGMHFLLNYWHPLFYCLTTRTSSAM